MDMLLRLMYEMAKKEGGVVGKITRFIQRAGGIVLALIATLAHPQTRAAEGESSRAGVAEAMALGPQQAALASLLGTWDVGIALSTGAKATQHSKGKAEYSWVVKGRWLGCHLTGQMLGLPYEQFTILGYDSYAKNVVQVAVESVDNSMLLSRGPTSGPDQPTTVLFGELDEYTTGTLHLPYKVVVKRLSPDRHTTAIFGFDDAGNEVRKVEFSFSRSK